MFIRICLLALLAVAGFSSTAHAMADYRVWYFDDNFNTYNEGDITDGWTKLVPPDWACGILFYDPSYYRWVDSNGVNIGDGDFNKNVRVWIGKPGCSEDLAIEYSDGSLSFPHESGGSYMEISTHYAFQWINDDGGWPTCGECVGPNTLTYFPDDVGWAQIVVNEFKTVKPSLLDTRLRSRSVSAIEALGKDVAALRPALRAEVIGRRKTHSLEELEPSVRALEDAALVNLYYASQLVSSCLDLAKAGRFSDAYAACSVGEDRVDAADFLIWSARYTFQRPSR